jgi:hypothetical protein
VKRPEWIFVGVITLIASYFIFNYLTRKEKFKEWDLVTSNAAIVYEGNSLIDTWNKLVESSIWESISKIDDVNKINRNLQLFDTISGGNGQLASLFKKQNILISAHVTSQDSYGLTYIIPLGKNGHTIFLNLLSNFQKQSNFSRSQRVYQALTIYEVELQELKISYILHKNTLVLSTEAFLVEDVVRNIQTGFKTNFINSYPSLSGNPSFAKDDGNLYINGSEISLFLNSFLSVKNKKGKGSELAEAIFFDINLTDNGLFASGFAFESGNNSITSTFKDQQAVEFKLMDLIPNNAAIVEHYGTSDLNKWYANWVTILDDDTIDIAQGEKFIGFAKNEIVHITLPSVDNQHLNKLFIAALSDVAGMYNHLNKIAENHIDETTDSLYIEYFAEKEIRLIDNEPILKHYFGSSFKSFSSTYYLIYNDYLVVSNTAETLRNWLIQIENEATWSKSVQMNAFFKNALTEANYTYVSNLEYGWNLQYDKLNNNVKSWGMSNSESIKEFNLLAFQISNLDNRYYTNLNLNYRQAPKVITDNNVIDVATIQLANAVLRKPQIVKNHTNGKWEILAQDSLTTMMLISNSGEILWEDSIGDPIEGNLYQIDFYKNSKLQYLFHSDSSLFLIDRNSSRVDNYPVKFDYKINQVYLIDYDRSKRYRILISDHFGNLRMYDKKGNLLEGWDPNVFSTNFSDDIFHVRVRGKDRMLIPLSKGEVHLHNRRGEEVEGFPLDLGMGITSKFFVRLGERFDDTEFITVSEEGLVVRFTMTGKMLSRNQLFKESDQSKFGLLIEKQGKDYVFVRNDLNRLSILSSDGELLFQKDFSTNSARTVQYYNFGSDRQLYVVKNDSSIYLYDKQGKLLTNIPLISDYPISLVYFGNENACQLYLTHENTIEIKKIHL